MAEHEEAPIDDAEEQWLEQVAAACKCCPVCWQVPCGGCLQGGLCDDYCDCEEEE